MHWRDWVTRLVGFEETLGLRFRWPLYDKRWYAGVLQCRVVALTVAFNPGKRHSTQIFRKYWRYHLEKNSSSPIYPQGGLSSSQFYSTALFTSSCQFHYFQCHSFPKPACHRLDLSNKTNDSLPQVIDSIVPVRRILSACILFKDSFDDIQPGNRITSSRSKVHVPLNTFDWDWLTGWATGYSWWAGLNKSADNSK